MGYDAVNEDETTLLCAVCCANISLMSNSDCAGCSGKAGICCLNAECCCKSGAPCLFPFACVGLKCEHDGCSLINGQCHACCLVASAAIPCNSEVPVAITVAGLTLYPTCGCMVKQRMIR